MPGPPPPPPMPPMGRGAGGPPPPPPMPGKAPGMKPPSGAGRGALLGDITKGARLKKVTQVNDRSAPIVAVGKVSDGPSGPPIGGAPPIPGMGKAPAPPSGLAPPAPGNRARSNSDTGSDGAALGGAGPPQLGGLFAGGMPKLRKSGGVKTGAETSSPYLSDPETTRNSAPKPPRSSAPKPPGAPPAPPVPGGRPPPPNPAISALRNNLRPSSLVSTHSAPDVGSKPRPPPPIGKKPPLPPSSSRKVSGMAPAPPPPASPARPPPPPGSIPSAPPPPPPSSSAPRPPPQSIPLAPPPPPPSSAPRPPPSRSTPPPPPPPSAPPTNHKSQEDEDYDPYNYGNAAIPRPPPAPAPKAPTPMNGLAEHAARNAFSRTATSPAAPPPPPPASPPPSAPSSAAPPPPPPSAPAPSIGRSVTSQSQSHSRSMLDASAYTLSNGGSKSGPVPTMNSSGYGTAAERRSRIIPIHDLRWRFQDEAQLPPPRAFSGGMKRYRAGRGSSVPLDLGLYE